MPGRAQRQRSQSQSGRRIDAGVADGFDDDASDAAAAKFEFDGNPWRAGNGGKRWTEVRNDMRGTASQQLHGVGASFVRTYQLPVKADERRTILLPFVHTQPQPVRDVLEFVRDLPEEEFRQEWEGVLGVFKKRHPNFAGQLLANYELASGIGG